MRIIISQPWGGLGDNLQFSTLPELYSNNGHEVCISVNNCVRNNEIFDLVWKTNPYIKGVCNDEDGLVVGANMRHMWPPDSQNEYFMHRIEIAHGFQKTNFYPKIYYTPKYIPEIQNDILIDLTGSSQVYEINKYIEYINYFVPLIENTNKCIKIIEFDNINVNIMFNDIYDYIKYRIQNIEVLRITDIYNYCDIINSCNMMIIVNSGVNSLASAIKQDKSTPNILCYNPWSHFNPETIKGFYNYKNINYFQSKIQE
jgi:hypothetical protein